KNGCASATSGSAGCSPPTASVGSSYHEWGLALDISTSGNRAVREWMHAVVACYAGDIKAPDPNAVYTPLPRAYSPEEYVKAKPCGDGEYPVKKANTFGLVFAVGCTDYVDPRSDSAVLCKGGRTEDWHAQPGIPLSVKTQVTTSAAAGSAGRVFSATTKEGCYQEGRNFDIRSTSGGVYDRQKVAQLAYAMFECVLRNSGYANQPPSKVTRGDGSVWDGKTLGFDSYATQVAAEAVVVGYCESGYTDKNIGSNNFTGKYGGVFQMGDGVASGYGPPGANKF